MTRKILNTNEKRRFDRHCVCPVCHKKIQDDENFLYTIEKVRRCKKYTFYHVGCIRKWVERKELVN